MSNCRAPILQQALELPGAVRTRCENADSSNYYSMHMGSFLQTGKRRMSGNGDIRNSVPQQPVFSLSPLNAVCDLTARTAHENPAYACPVPHARLHNLCLRPLSLCCFHDTRDNRSLTGCGTSLGSPCGRV